MTMTLDTASIKALTEEIAQAKAEFTEKGKAMFSEISKQLFERHPQLESFGWKQYTDYFADGDPCTFGVHADLDWGLEINGESTSELDNIRKTAYLPTGKRVMQKQYDYKTREYVEVEVDEKAYLPNPDYDPVLGDMANDVADLVNGMPSEILEDMFGDHVEVTVSKDGISIDEYTEHD